MTGVQDQAVDVAAGAGTSEVPFRITCDLLVPAERYHDQGFFAAEKEVWLHVWQLHAAERTSDGTR
jgi:hypothetical protein